MFDKEIARSLFRALDEHWINTPSNFGMRRPSYSEEEEEAAQFFIREAKKLDIPACVDRAGNYYFVLQGKNPSLAAIVSGSHVDSVPRGGRYDGPAGIVAAFSILVAFKKQGIVPPQTLCAMVVRGEEGAWFGQVSIGAKLSIGDIPYEQLQQLQRADTSISLKDAMRQIGLEPDTLKHQPVLFPLHETACFIELHIEQGPLLKDGK
jgi:N-carbamoyl-L-amino-acid hydrolase